MRNLQPFIKCSQVDKDNAKYTQDMWFERQTPSKKFSQVAGLEIKIFLKEKED